MFFSCAKEELDYGKLNLIGEPKPITANATLPKSASVDKTLVGSDGKVKWESTDQIVVNGSTLDITSIASSGTEAVFSGTAGAMIGTNGYWATYPFAPQRSDYTNTSVKVALPATQTYSSGDRLQNYMVAYAVSADPENISFAFRNLCSIIKIPVRAASGKTGDAAKLSRIEIVSNQNVSGEATVTMDEDGNPSMAISGGSKNVTLYCGNKMLKSSGSVDADTFSIMVPAGTHSLTVKFYDATGKYMQLTLSGAGSGVAITRNSIYTTGVVELDATLEYGTFSVSSASKVKFSPGNLQYQASTDTWRFAEHQWDYIGNAAGNNTTSDRSKQAAWIDLFGWGTGTNPCLFSASDDDYTEFADWGCNAIYNPLTGQPDSANTWRTLNGAEWLYLLGTSGSTRGGEHTGWWIYDFVKIAAADGANDEQGLIIYPDGITGKPAGVMADLGRDNMSITTITRDEFDALEAAGCIFLPVAGYYYYMNFIGIMVYAGGSNNWGYYWSSTAADRTGSARYLYFIPGTTLDANSQYSDCCRGQAVRLVKDID